MPRYFIFLKYKGTAYHGWQKQPNAKTVQQVLDEKLSLLMKENIETTGAGRTDTGVHAREFAAHFETMNVLTADNPQFLYKINSLLPYDISVYQIRKVIPEAHARFDAVSRTYEYCITTLKDPFLTDYAYYFPWPLDISKMNEASKMLFNYIDFSSFSKLHTDVKTNNCKIFEAFWNVQNHQLVFIITADRFLRNMVRAIVGTLIEVGKNKISLDEFCAIIEKKDRCAASTSAPAHGLYLTKIDYPLTIFPV